MKNIAIASALLVLAAAPACSGKDDKGGAAPDLTVTISGEGNALTGFAFPPASDNDPAFVDGWDVRFDRILVTVDSITLSDNPDMSPTDQAQVGRPVAMARGPWAVDMTKPGAVTNIRPRSSSPGVGIRADHDHDHALLGDGKDPQAQILARFGGLDGDREFDPATRYAFGFDIITASDGAQRTNLDGPAAADYAEMVAKGLSVLYVGSATWKGGTSCTSSDPAYDWSAVPKTVKFRLGFKSPTTYKNCQNTDLRGKAFDGEEAQRGVQVRESGETIAQITLHVDHPWWNTVDHDASELFFDQMAVAANADGMLVTDDLASLDFTSFKDKAGKPLPWRSCIASKPAKEGTRSFDSGSVAMNPGAPASQALRSYQDFVLYQQSTQGHLNADGLCAIQRNFDAPE